MYVWFKLKLDSLNQLTVNIILMFVLERRHWFAVTGTWLGEWVKEWLKMGAGVVPYWREGNLIEFVQ